MTLICCDARSLPLDDASVQCCVTSPPYYGLRDYGIKGQIGLEATPEAYVAQLVAVFREVRRVLKDDGTLWLNLGDSYWGGKGENGSSKARATASERGFVQSGGTVQMSKRPQDGKDAVCKPKDLIGIPWRMAFALQADGWYLRSDIIWSKPNPMPESVTDRPTKAHEYLFLLSKSARYYYDPAAIAEPASAAMLVEVEQGYDGKGTKNYEAAGVQNPSSVKARIIANARKQRGKALISPRHDGNAWNENNGRGFIPNGITRNRRTVWTIPTQPYPGAHFATMPEALVEPCILAGSRCAGRRCDCDEVIDTPLGSGTIHDPTMTTGRAGMNRPRRPDEGRRPITRREQREHAEQMRVSPFRAEMATAAGEAFAHYIRTDRSGARPLPPELLRRWLSNGWLKPATSCDCADEPADIILDPFCGTGTVVRVARRLGREGVGCDLNPEYLKLARERIEVTWGLPLASPAPEPQEPRP